MIMFQQQGKIEHLISFVLCRSGVILVLFCYVLLVSLTPTGGVILGANQCDTTVNSNTYRAGIDLYSFNSANDPLVCANNCCNDSQCFAWQFFPPNFFPNNPNAICRIKGWIPPSTPQTNATSGVIVRSPRVPPALPNTFVASFDYSYSSSSAKLISRDTSGLATCYYDNAGAKFGCYYSFINGTVLIYLYRYDLKKQYVIEEQIINNTVKTNCHTFALPGSIFSTSVLSSLTYTHQAIFNDEPVSGFKGSVVLIGASTWYVSEGPPATVAQVTTQDGSQYTTIKFEGYAFIPPGVWNDPLTYCNSSKIV